MKTCEHEGRLYRELRDDEVILRGDMISERSSGDWFQVNDSAGYEVRQYKAKYGSNELASTLIWFREIDPLIAEMLKVKGQK